MALTWRGKRQLFYYSVFSLVILLIIGGLIYFFSPDSTCFDGKQNQSEEGIDCGGPCAKGCLGKVDDVSLLWTRFFKVGESKYDVAALIDNHNIFAGSDYVRYRFKIHDKNNLLIAIRDGVTFVNPQERFVIFEPEIETARRVPTTVSIEIDPIEWNRVEFSKPSIEAFGYKFTGEPFGHFEATLRNGDIFPVENIEVTVVLLDENRNASAVSRTKIDQISGESQRQVGFSWPVRFAEDPALVELYIRKIP